ncbi:hypothetical protein NE857_21315 [Nocardiopsis exhalans]|uniref:Uncharacterized protein n=1 Tax=Nocardiopsis exhalans TaxID=163604 RepID=A0ABY5D281_9ACTN|nr:hypothetical protein [Nocardiopsis exhalans]USY17856.1 hypothetical protein NE857_21315 [Nocardiopsis exhalans]
MHGGLGQSRPQASTLTPDRLERLRPTIDCAEDAGGCPVCATWSWIKVVGANYNWSRSLMCDSDAGTPAANRLTGRAT